MKIHREQWASIASHRTYRSYGDYDHLQKPYGFTLIELLVVIAVLAALAMLLLSSFNYVMQRSETVRCINSMRQIAAALHAYRNDHDGWLPPGYPAAVSSYAIPPPGLNVNAAGTLHAHLTGYLTDLRHTATGSTATGEIPFCPGGLGGAARNMDNDERNRRIRGSYSFNSLLGTVRFDAFPLTGISLGDGILQSVGPNKAIFDPSRYPFLLEIRADGGNLTTWSFTHQNQALNGSFGETGTGWGQVSPGRSHGYGDALNFLFMAGNVETIARNDFRDIPPMNKSWDMPNNPQGMFHHTGQVPNNIPGRTAGEKVYFPHGQVSYGLHKRLYPQFSNWEEN